MLPVRRRFHPALSLVRVPLLSVTAALGLLLLLMPTAYAAPLAQPMVALPNSTPAWVAGAQAIGQHNATDLMTVGVVLPTTHQDQQRQLLTALNNPSSSLYHQWLQTGQYDALFAPSSTAVAAAKSFLAAQGLTLQASNLGSAVLLASGTTQQVETAFSTTINDYRLANGQQYFANATSVRVPAALSGSISGVLGLSSLGVMRSDAIADQVGASAPYGGGPHGKGLTPSQIAGIYNAKPVYTKLGDKGQGVTLAVFELSGYTHSDISFYEKTFSLSSVPVVDKPVLGGPIAIGGSKDYGADEVELDIELQIALAPGAAKILVYNAPNTDLGVIGEYLQIAKDNKADSISSSWGTACEYGTSTQVVQAENQAFIQMGLQGQSFATSSGDAGAYGCTSVGLSLPLPDALQLGDPSSQPYVTSVGGTSFRQQNRGSVNFDPGSNPNPTYPGTKAEQTWNQGCNLASCVASGGGVSRFWGSGDYAFDSTGTPLPGVVESVSQAGSFCGQQPGVLCREAPDISLNADPGTGYAIYCTNVGSDCLNPAFSIKGWTRFGGTSCSAPLWAAAVALYDSHHGHGYRAGLFNYIIYPFDSAAGYAKQLHDITIGDNGYYPAGAGYDMSTGLGTPNIYNLVNS